MNFKTVNISVGPEGEELMAEKFDDNEEFWTMRGMVLQHEDRIWICVYTEVVMTIGKLNSGMNTSKYIVHALPGEIYNDDNFEMAIQKCMHDLLYLQTNFNSLGMKSSFDFEVIRKFNTAHPFRGCYLRIRKYFLIQKLILVDVLCG
jgi:hypothetical protein